ncbi:hypothetical protein AOLI_G00263120 [Acnodon oligacanthus]
MWYQPIRAPDGRDLPENRWRKIKKNSTAFHVTEAQLRAECCAVIGQSSPVAEVQRPPFIFRGSTSQKS